MKVTQTPTVVITGASSGIGRALAHELARRGYALGLTARRMPLLETLRSELLAAHGEKIRIELASLDVCRTESVSETLHDLFARLGGVETVVVNAGVNDLIDIGAGQLEKEINLIQTNVIGAIATIDAAAKHFIQAGKGHIVGISSLASLQPIPRQAAYCASKAALAMYLASARMELQAKGIDVTDIRPGYIATDIVDGVEIGKLPFAITADQAAREMVALIERRVKKGIVPRFPWAYVRPLLGHLPKRFLGV